MKTSDLLAALLHVFEGCRLEAYQDSGGVWTIGFGHTAGVKRGDVCTVEQAEQWLGVDSAPLLKLVHDLSLDAISPVASAAWCSFGYDKGYHGLQLALEGKLDMLTVVHDRLGHVLPGLVARRKLEWSLIQSAAPVSA